MSGYDEQKLNIGQTIERGLSLSHTDESQTTRINPYRIGSNVYDQILPYLSATCVRMSSRPKVEGLSIRITIYLSMARVHCVTSIYEKPDGEHASATWSFRWSETAESTIEAGTITPSMSVATLRNISSSLAHELGLAARMEKHLSSLVVSPSTQKYSMSINLKNPPSEPSSTHATSDAPNTFVSPRENAKQ